MRQSRVVALLLAASAASVSCAQGALGLERYDNDKVVRVRIEDEKQAAFMQDLGADMWSHRGGVGLREYRVTPEQLRTLQNSGLAFDVVVENVQALVDAERSTLLAPRGGAGYFQAYHRYEVMSQFVTDLQVAYPGRATRVSVGHSIEGREIFGVKITGANGPSEKPAVVFSAMQHAREWISGTTALYLANELLEGYGVDERITSTLDDVDIYIIPVSNPDGYVWTWDVSRLWRKNRRVNGGGTFGVDTNRNFSVGWGLNGGSGNFGSSETYRGVAPFSEPESTALANFIESIPLVRAHVDLHSYSELVLSPWGWTVAPTDDAAAFDSLNSSLQDAIAGVHGRVYTVGPAGSTLYIASGTAPDWSYGTLGAFGWTIELRPATAAQGGFVLPPSEIIPTGEEIMPAMFIVAEFAAGDVYLHGLREPLYIDASSGAEISIGATPTRGASIAEESSALRYRVGAAGEFQSAPLSFDSTHFATAQLPGFPCGQNIEYYFEIASSSGTHTFPEGGASAPRTLAALNASVALDDDFSTDTGWTVGAVGDSATTGVWVRGVPNATNYQPGSGDPNGSGGACFYTGFSNPGAADGTQDIDGGHTTLTSPLLDATSGPGDAYLAYSRWHGSNGAAGEDYLRTYLSNDAGANWTLVDVVNQDARVWTRRQIRIADFMLPTSAMRVRFVAADAGVATVSEAAVDDVRIVILGCDALAGDTNGDGVVNFADLNAVLVSFGTAGAPGFDPADFDNDGDVDFADLNTVLANFGATR